MFKTISRRTRNTLLWAAAVLLALTGFTLMPGLLHPQPSAAGPSIAGPSVSVQTASTPLAPAAACSGGFVAQALDHITQPHGAAVHQFESNGSGVAINDLDGDGRLDIVLANLNGPATILWNQGGFNFRKQTLDETNTRAAAIVDVDGDGRPDIVFTHIATTLSYWRNLPGPGGQPVFEMHGLPGVAQPAHAMAWGDLNGDGRLDLVTGSYDAELAQQPGGAFLFNGGAGLYYYASGPDGYTVQRLSAKSQTLAIALFDVNGDGRLDILAGNDFDTPDMAWLNTAGGMQPARPFAATSHHTMNFDWADLDNNGSFELFSTDMAPVDSSVSALAQWLPMMATMTHRVPKGDPQTDANVLQVLGADGHYHNQAPARGIDASGWSWSGKFGDLNNDGHQDLYVVNGMIDAELFKYLPNAELAEPNQAFRSLGDGAFAPAPEWNLASLSSGRGMSLADLDGDGRLDIVVNNLRSPAQLFENQTCGGQALEVDLRWPESANTRALGAVLALHTSAGVYTRDVRAVSGYLSGDPSRVHFGLPAGAAPTALDIRWPDGSVSSLAAPAANSLLTITR